MCFVYKSGWFHCLINEYCGPRDIVGVVDEHFTFLGFYIHDVGQIFFFLFVNYTYIDLFIIIYWVVVAGETVTLRTGLSVMH